MGKPNNDDPPTQLVPAQPKPPILVGDRGLQLRTFDDMWRYATCVAESGMAPKGLDKPASIVVALQMGAELGLSPMASLQNIAVINGRPSVWGDAMLAICRGSGLFDEAAFEERLSADGQTASCTVRRLPNSKPVTQTFSVEDAKRAGVWEKRGRDGQPTAWVTYPKRMLQMRARSFALRDTFPDVLRGIYSAEEVGDFIDAPAAPPDLQAMTDKLRVAAGVPV